MGPQDTERLLNGKDTSIQAKWQTTEWEDIFANYIPKGGLMSKIYKEVKKKKYIKKKQNKTWNTDLWEFSTEEARMAKKHLENVRSHKGNANQNHSAISCYSSQSGQDQ